MTLCELSWSHHHGVRTPIIAQPGILAQALEHGQVRLAPGVIFRCRVPIHVGDGGALRRI